jgi:hypothetical protein
MSRENVYYWVREFRNFGRESVEDSPRSGRSATTRNEQNIQAVDDMIKSDRRISTWKIASRLGTDQTAVQDIIHEDFGHQKISARWIPKAQTEWDKPHE